MTGSRATAAGVGAIVLWSLLALLTVGTAPVPPFLLNALAFGTGGLAGLAWIAAAGTWGRLAQVRPGAYAVVTAGLFLYHALYFSALRLAPPAAAGLIAYLWPLLIVLLSGLLPGERLLRRHVVGALVAFAGAALIVVRGGAAFAPEALPGFGLAFLCALTWSGYSVLLRRMAAVPTEAVAIACLATAALSVPLHLALEETLWPEGGAGWAAIVALGLGPAGAAFYLWDIGMKRGNLQLLGVSAYAAPLLSTLALIAAGIAEPEGAILVAAALIAAGAAIAARARPRRLAGR